MRSSRRSGPRDRSWRLEFLGGGSFRARVQRRGVRAHDPTGCGAAGHSRGMAGGVHSLTSCLEVGPRGPHQG
eukprot:8853788-Pyramimonas_sp.AAC.1